MLHRLVTAHPSTHLQSQHCLGHNPQRRSLKLAHRLPRAASSPSAMILQETHVKFTSPCGETLAGILTEPAAAAAAEPDTAGASSPFTAAHCAILCHGFASHKNGFHFPAIAAHLATRLGMVSAKKRTHPAGQEKGLLLHVACQALFLWVAQVLNDA
jgi:hypothetical protein